MGNHMLRPSVGRLKQAKERPFVLDSGPAIENLGRRVPHDIVYEILVPFEVVAICSEWQNLTVFFNAYGRGQCVAIAVDFLTLDKQISCDFVCFEPDVCCAHDLPCIYGSVLFVQCAEMEGSVEATFGNVPESTRPRKTCEEAQPIVSIAICLTYPAAAATA